MLPAATASPSRLKIGAATQAPPISFSSYSVVQPVLRQRSRMASSASGAVIVRVVAAGRGRIEETTALEGELRRKVADYERREKELAREWEKRESEKLKELERRTDQALADADVEVAEVGRVSGERCGAAAALLLALASLGLGHHLRVGWVGQHQVKRLARDWRVLG